MAAADKDTIYIDIDDEITGVIDKVKNSKSKVVALVLPKRASVFQSIVNMKLLKRAADSSSKNLVLITTETGLMPLAGAAGIHVAKTLSSKPEIPLAPSAAEDIEEPLDEATSLPAAEEEPPIDPTQSVGELAGDEPPSSKLTNEALDTVTLDNKEDEPSAKDAADDKETKSKNKEAAKQAKKLKVPNFDRFRKYLLLGGLGLIILIILFLILNGSLSKATINITTDATNVNANLNLNLSTTASSVSTSNGTIPAKLDQEQKTYSQQTSTTGQQNNGSKASGVVSMTAQYCNGNFPPSGGPPSIPAGTGLSSNGLTFITQTETDFSSNNNYHNGCFDFPSTANTPIQAQAGGSSYNNADSFSVAGYSNISVSVSQAVSGGTDNIVQVVNQNDINNAKAKITTTDNTVKSDLESQLKGQGYYAIDATYSAGTPNVTSSANVGDVANTVTVTETVTYTMFGVKQNDLKTLVDNNVNSQIDTAKQSILDDGLSSANFSVNSQNTSGAQIALTTTAVAGPQLNINSIKQQAAGKRVGDVKTELETDPDVTGVSVKLSPFWVTSVPHSASKITVDIAKPTNTKSGS